MEARIIFPPRNCPLGPKLPNLFPMASSNVQILSFPQCLLDNHTFSRSPTKKFHLRSSGFDEESTRPLIKFPPSLWNDYFLTVAVDDSEFPRLGREIDSLKPRVTDMLMSSYGDAKEKIRLIYLLICLGLSYHFENEIEENLKHAFQAIEDTISDEDDLYTISIMFWVFRLYGHNMSCDVFDRFKGDDGKFKKCLAGDVKGMLSLYEASHMGTTEEDIMDEALSFTLSHLESLAARASPHTRRLIENALHRPQYHDMEILFAREYISFYEQEEEHNKMLLKLAKLHFKFLQQHYIQELKTVAKWWKDLDLIPELPYVRDRMVESYFWALTIYFEPQYSPARITLAKFCALLTVVDDTYDAYGTLSEVVSLTDAAERWDPEVIDTLPDYIKIVFRFLLDFFEDLKHMLVLEGRSYSVQDTEEELKRLMRAYLAIAKWARAGHVPTYEEYMEVGQVTGGVDVLVAGSFLGMGHVAGREAYEWLKSRPKFTQALDMKGRLIDDIATYRDEMSRGEVANGINCYMKQYGVSEEEAFTELRKRLKHAYKIVNEEFLNTSAVPRQLLLRALNFGRLMDVVYKYVDGLTYPEGKIKGYIDSLLLEPIHL